MFGVVFVGCDRWFLHLNLSTNSEVDRSPGGRPRAKNYRPLYGDGIEKFGFDKEMVRRVFGLASTVNLGEGLRPVGRLAVKTSPTSSIKQLKSI